jgi:hypothetical protein
MHTYTHIQALTMAVPGCMDPGTVLSIKSSNPHLHPDLRYTSPGAAHRSDSTYMYVNSIALTYMCVYLYMHLFICTNAQTKFICSSPMRAAVPETPQNLNLHPHAHTYIPKHAYTQTKVIRSSPMRTVMPVSPRERMFLAPTSPRDHNTRSFEQQRPGSPLPNGRATWTSDIYRHVTCM